jgi:hypothetical protein
MLLLQLTKPFSQPPTYLSPFANFLCFIFGTAITGDAASSEVVPNILLLPATAAAAGSLHSMYGQNV